MDKRECLFRIKLIKIRFKIFITENYNFDIKLKLDIILQSFIYKLYYLGFRVKRCTPSLYTQRIKRRVEQYLRKENTDTEIH